MAKETAAELSAKVGEGNFPRSRVDISCKFFLLFVQIPCLVLLLLRERFFAFLARFLLLT